MLYEYNVLAASTNILHVHFNESVFTSATVDQGNLSYDSYQICFSLLCQNSVGTYHVTKLITLNYSYVLGRCPVETDVNVGMSCG
jgi:hypothetical protein